jgi:hypothetical protein
MSLFPPGVLEKLGVSGVITSGPWMMSAGVTCHGGETYRGEGGRNSRHRRVDSCIGGLTPATKSARPYSPRPRDSHSTGQGENRKFRSALLERHGVVCV